MCKLQGAYKLTANWFWNVIFKSNNWRTKDHFQLLFFSNFISVNREIVLVLPKDNNVIWSFIKINFIKRIYRRNIAFMLHKFLKKRLSTVKIFNKMKKIDKYYFYTGNISYEMPILHKYLIFTSYIFQVNIGKFISNWRKPNILKLFRGISVECSTYIFLVKDILLFHSSLIMTIIFYIDY